MPRNPAVYRTMKITCFNCLCIDIDSQQSREEAVRMLHVPKNVKKLNARLEKVLNDDSTKFLKVISAEQQKVRYKMDEDVYIKNADVISIEKI